MALKLFGYTVQLNEKLPTRILDHTCKWLNKDGP